VKDERTFSEKLFEKYCGIRKYSSRKIPSGDDRTPDYQVKTPAGVFVCEVTQLEDSPEDSAWFEEVMKNGGSWSGIRPSSEISKKVRNRIKKKFQSKQLLPDSQNGLPTLLILYDATRRFYLDHFSLNGAMYGDQQAWISNNSHEKAIVEHGGNRLFRENVGSYISAVAILHSTPSLEVIHNYFSDVPFPPELLSDPMDKHWIKPSNPHN
jgi:hypothetical protein